MKYEKLEYYASSTRLNRFLIASGHSKARAEQFYRTDLAVSQAFYSVLNLFEVALRNKCYDQVSSHFRDPNWITTEKSGFMSHGSLMRSQFFLKTSVNNAERNIKKKVLL